MTSAALATSADGQWVAVRRGDAITLLPSGVAPTAGTVTLGSEDADIAFVGSMLVAVVRNIAPRVMLYQLPGLDVIARHDLAAPMRLGAVTGTRIVLVSAEHKKLVIVRVAPQSLGAQTIDLDGPLDFIVGLEKQQLLLSIQKKLEVWDATTGRPLLRMQLQLPPPPRTVGVAQGHLWLTRPNADDIILYRLSDGRPFRHIVGAVPVDVVSSPVTPIVIVGTARHVVRVHCFAHSISVIDAPWTPGMPLAQLAVADDVSLLGLDTGNAIPWRVPIAGAGAPALPQPTAEEPLPEPAPTTEPNKFRALRDRSEERAASGPQAVVGSSPGAPSSGEPPVTTRASRPTSGPAKHAKNWREPFAALGAELVRGGSPDLAPPLDGTAVAELADQLLLSQRSIRALVALYGLYLVGEPALAIADLATLLGDWTEPLGVGELGALAMLRRKHGRVALRAAVTDLLDGVKPSAVRLVGSHAAKPRPGAWRLTRDGKTDAELEQLFATALGRVAIVDGDPDRGILEARLHGATAIAYHPPPHPPRPWPRDASLVLVLYGSASSWMSDLPNLDL